MVVWVGFVQRFLNCLDGDTGGYQFLYGAHETWGICGEIYRYINWAIKKNCSTCFFFIGSVVKRHKHKKTFPNKIMNCFTANHSSSSSYEHYIQKRKLDDFFAMRSLKEKLLRSMPTLNLGECDPRARARGVYVLSMRDAGINDNTSSTSSVACDGCN